MASLEANSEERARAAQDMAFNQSKVNEGLLRSISFSLAQIREVVTRGWGGAWHPSLFYFVPLSHSRNKSFCSA